MKIETLNSLWYNGFTTNPNTSRNFEKGDQDLMDKIIPTCCPLCNSHSLYKYGKDKSGNQKYQCRICKHQFAPNFVSNSSNTCTKPDTASIPLKVQILQLRCLRFSTTSSDRIVPYAILSFSLYTTI